METYHVAYKTAAGIKQITSLRAFDKADAKWQFHSMSRIDNNMFFDCTVTRVWLKKPPTGKQKLAQKYGFAMGCVKSAKVSVNQAIVEWLGDSNGNEKQNRAINLVSAQFAKLQRDIADLFRLAGLKIK